MNIKTKWSVIAKVIFTVIPLILLGFCGLIYNIPADDPAFAFKGIFMFFGLAATLIIACFLFLLCACKPSNETWSLLTTSEDK
jgi:hypothetical protein